MSINPLISPYSIPLLAWQPWLAALGVLFIAGLLGWVLSGRNIEMRNIERWLLSIILGFGFLAVLVLLCGQKAGFFTPRFFPAVLTASIIGLALLKVFIRSQS